MNRSEWWTRLRPAVGRAGDLAGVTIDDSKKVLAAADGRARLRRAASSLLRCAGWKGGTLEELLFQVAPSDAPRVAAEHWFAADPGAGSPAPDEETELAAALARAGVSLLAARARVLVPSAFNARLAALGNKAAVELELVGDLLRRSIESLQDGHESCRIVVDRLGGRKFYRELVEDIADGAFVSTIDECSVRSAYRFPRAGRDVDCSFEVQADGRTFAVAAASMLAKYLRERCMEGFNAFWSRRRPGIAPTAGYPADAGRFLDEIDAERQALGIAIEELWRRK